MSREDELKEVKVRLANLEKAFFAYNSLVVDILPPAYAEDANVIMDKYFDSVETFYDIMATGAEFQTNKTPESLR